MRYCLIFLFLIGLTLPAAAQDPEYVGNDLLCAGCHNPVNPGDAFGLYPGAPAVDFDAYMDSGHPWKIHRTFGLEPAVDEWPHTPVPPLPTIDGTQLDWSDVEYVIGNFFWKARFIDRRGYIWTGTANDSTQWNLGARGGPQGFVPYHAGDVDKPFNCGKCHTTGYSEFGHQGGVDPNTGDPNFPGLIGTWSQDGVRCEACHGPASAHLANLETHPAGGKDCGDCHQRDFDSDTGEQFWRMPWKGGFMRHHQQAEDLSHSPHKNLACKACHNPHRSVVYDDGGVKNDCEACHNPNGVGGKTYEVNVPAMAGLECTDCHMAFIAKSATVTDANGHRGDVHGHLFRISTEAKEAWQNVVDKVTGEGFATKEDALAAERFWAQDADGNSVITLDYACLSCHDGPDDDVAWAAEHAAGIHDFPEPPGDNWDVIFPLTGAPGFQVSFTEFAGYLLVETTHADGSTSYGIGFEFDGYIIWLGLGSRDIYFGTIDRGDGSMSGFVLGEGPNKGSAFLGQPL